MSVLVRFDEIPETGKRLAIKDESWFPVSEFKKMGSVEAEVFLERKGRRVFLEGILAAEIMLDCDRCLEPYVYSLPGEIRVVFELGEKKAPKPVEYPLSRSEIDIVMLDDAAIDIFDVLMQHVVLHVPYKKICKPACRGLCSRCGTNLNDGACRCADNDSNSPFSVLKRLKQ